MKRNQTGLLGNVVQGGGLLPTEPADQQDRRFGGWFRRPPVVNEFVAKYDEEPNPADPDYDYRAAYRAGIEPKRYAPDGGRYHWPSKTFEGYPLKSENHP